MFMKQYAPNRCEPSIEVRSGGGGGHGAYSQRISVIAKMLKKSRVGRGGGCQGGYEQRIEVIVKIAQKKVEGSNPGVGVRVDANDENAKKKKKKKLVSKCKKKSQRVRSWPRWMRTKLG